MKILYKIPAAGVVMTACLLGGNALADNTDNSIVTVGGQLIASLELTAIDALRFGTIAIPTPATDAADVNTTAQVNVTNFDTGAFTMIYTGAGAGTGNPGTSNLPVNHGPAKLRVDGQPLYNYAVAYSGFGSVPLAAGMTANLNVIPTQTIPASGSDDLYIGGTLTLTAASGVTVGVKTGTIDVTVTYD